MKAQNWLAIFLDFIIVVSGVFIGLQLANWNDWRLEREREEGALVALLEEAEDNISYIDAIIMRTEPARADREAALAMLRGEPVTEGNPENGLLLMDDFRDLTPIASTYQELTASGDIALIQSEPLRRQLALVQGVNLFNDRRREEFVADAPDILEKAAAYVTIEADPDTFTPSRITVDWTRARQDQELVNAVNRVMIDQRTWFARYEVALRQTVITCVAIADTLAAECEPEDWAAAEARGELVDTGPVATERIDAFMADLQAD